jgi:hypothetical protein
VQYPYYVGVAGNNPGMEERIPVHWILGSKPTIERVRISQHLWVKQMVKTQRFGSIVGHVGNFWDHRILGNKATASF